MRQTASARSIAEACADRRRVGDGDVNLADVWRAAPTGGVRVDSPGRVRVATMELDRPIVRVLAVHDDGVVSRYQA